MKKYKAKILTSFTTYCSKADTIEEAKQAILDNYNSHNETSYTLEELELKHTIRIDINDEPVYLSYDGKEFDTDMERSNYEYAQKYRDVMKIEQNKGAEGLCPCEKIKYDENTAYWFKPKTDEEITALNRFMAESQRNYYKLSHKDIGKVFCVEVVRTQPQKAIWISSENECIEHIKKLLDALGYDADITKRKNKL